MRLLIAGAGGHGRVVADAAENSAEGWAEIAFVDDQYPELSTVASWQVVGKLSDLSQLEARYEACFAAVGDARLRLELLERLRSAGYRMPVIAHPRASISRHSRVESGTFIAAGAIVNIGTEVGIGCIINTGATVDHDCHLGAGVHICPGAHLAGGIEIGARTWIGIGAIARQGIRIGADVTVGAGAVCLEDVRDGVVVVGAPAREKRA
jgi:sugar O-acyltransferase (sialic acid O-acetyltransferase NeuD family)